MTIADRAIAEELHRGEYSRHTVEVKVTTEPFTSEDTNEVVPVGTVVEVKTFEDGSALMISAYKERGPSTSTQSTIHG